MTKRTEIEDARGNRVHFVRQIPSWGVTLVILGADGSSAELLLEGDQLLDFAESVASYAETFVRMKR
jgi:hypothetical protein